MDKKMFEEAIRILEIKKEEKIKELNTYMYECNKKWNEENDNIKLYKNDLINLKEMLNKNIFEITGSGLFLGIIIYLLSTLLSVINISLYTNILLSIIFIAFGNSVVLIDYHFCKKEIETKIKEEFKLKNKKINLEQKGLNLEIENDIKKIDPLIKGSI